jgi:hypothetical protein
MVGQFSHDVLILYLHHAFISIGERRIRVITQALPTTSNLSEVFASADQVAIATLLANKAVERSLTHKLEDAREAVFQKLVDILQTYKSSMTAAGAGASAQLSISDNLKMLPVLILGLLKNVSICGCSTLLSLPNWVLGGHPPKCSNSTRPSGICASPLDVPPITAPDSLHPSDILFIAQHASGSE